MDDSLEEKATEGVIEFIEAHKQEIANSVGDYDLLRPMLKLINQMKKEEK